MRLNIKSSDIPKNVVKESLKKALNKAGFKVGNANEFLDDIMMHPVENKKIIEECLIDCQNISNFTHRYNKPNVAVSPEFCSFMNILGWYKHHDLKPGNFNNYKILTKIFRTKPIFKQYTLKNAVWVFTYRSSNLIILHNKEGLSIQVENENKRYISNLIFYLEKILCSKGDKFIKGLKGKDV